MDKSLLLYHWRKGKIFYVCWNNKYKVKVQCITREIRYLENKCFEKTSIYKNNEIKLIKILEFKEKPEFNGFISSYLYFKICEK